MASCLPATDISHWYCEDPASVFAPATSAFEEARAIFERQGTRDPKKKNRLRSIQATTLTDVLDIVNTAQKHLKNQDESKTRRYIQGLSQRICYYGNIMDVLIQHHPEYVSLAWGAMKLLFGAIVEHEKMGMVIANGLLDIADALPRIELVSSLYPTLSIKRMVAVLYAHVIRFLLRALEWYEEGAWKRAIHSVTKPAPLRYNDILESIHRVTQAIVAQSVAGSQAEQRDMHKEIVAIREIVEAGHETNAVEHKELHLKLKLLLDLVEEVKTLIISNQITASTERAQICQSLSNIQSAQVLDIISAQCSIDHGGSLQTSRALRDRRHSMAKIKCAPFWTSPRLQAWNQSSASSLISVKVPFTDRQPVQDFCINVIEQLLHARTAILWVLQHKDDTHSIIDALKSLIQQAANLTYESQGEKALSSQLDRFIQAHLEDHYLDVLTDLLCHLRIVYITVQLEAIQPVCTTKFITCLQNLIHRLSNCEAQTVVRILVLTWRPGGINNSEANQMQCVNLQVRKTSRRKGVQLPKRPLSTKMRN